MEKVLIVDFLRHTLKGGGGLKVCMQSVVFTSQTYNKDEKYITCTPDKYGTSKYYLYQVTDLDCTVT